MLNLQGITRSLQRFEVVMKPTGMSKRKKGVTRTAEVLYELTAENKEQAAAEARKAASIEGFNGYAVTKIKEIRA